MIESVDSCLTCENLVDSLKCKKHDLSVEINNVCSDHSIKKAFSKLSSSFPAVLCKGFLKAYQQLYSSSAQGLSKRFLAACQQFCARAF